jgi:hypothetical protein
MKLAKATLIKSTTEGLAQLGYQLVKDTVTGAAGLFIKQVKDDYFLSLGFTISRYYESRFTVSYYLSKTTRWSAYWMDIPRESYERPGKFLTKAERKLYLDDEYNEKGVIDVWWDGNNIDEINKMLEVIKITENRFLGQEDLFKKIDESIEVKELVRCVNTAIALLSKEPDTKFSYQFIPQKPIDDIPPILFKVAEKALVHEKAILNLNTVKSLAADVWHQIQINPVLKKFKESTYGYTKRK